MEGEMKEICHQCLILTFHLNVELAKLVLQLTLQHTHVLKRAVSGNICDL